MRMLLDSIRLCKAESFYRLGEFDEVFELVVVAHDLVADTPTGFDNQAR